MSKSTRGMGDKLAVADRGSARRQKGGGRRRLKMLPARSQRTRSVADDRRRWRRRHGNAIASVLGTSLSGNDSVLIRAGFCGGQRGAVRQCL